MPHRYPWDRAGNQRPLIRRAADIAPAGEPLGTQALDQVAGEGFGRLELRGDGLHVVFSERKVLRQSLGVILVRACTECTCHRTVEVEGHSGVEQVRRLPFVAAMQVNTCGPEGQDVLNARAMLDSQRRGQWLGILRNRRFDHLLSHPVARLDHEGRLALFFRCYVARLDLLFSRPPVLPLLIRRSAVVELVQHLRLVKRQVPVIGTDENVPFPPIAVGLQLLCGAEVVGVVSQVEEAL